MIVEYNEYIENLKQDKSENTIRVYATSIELFLNHFNVNSLHDIDVITPKNVREYQTYLSSTGLSNSSVNSRMRPVSAFLNYLVANEEISRNVTSNVKAMKVSKKLPDFLSDEEIKLMLDVCNDQELVMLSVMLSLGVRREELVNIKVRDIKVDQTISIIGKGNKQRIIYIPDDVYHLIKEYLKTHSDEYLFNAQGRSGKMSGNSVNEKIKSLGKRAGLSEERVNQLHAHLTRHTAFTNLLTEGVDIAVIQAIAGHESIKTTQIYAHVKDVKIEEAMKNRKRLSEYGRE